MAQFQCNISSPTLNMMMQYYVIIPDDATPETKKDMPVLYLLHGLSDNASGWTRLTSIERYARNHGCAVIMPEVQRSFYTDMEYGLPYFQFIIKDLKMVAKNFFALPTDREHSYIAGLSMGGYGALKAGLRHPEEFIACAGFSSAVGVQEYLDNKTLAVYQEEVAIYGKSLKVKPEDDVYALAEKYADRENNPRIFLSCGTNDVLFPNTTKLKGILEKGNYDLLYWDYPEDHTWNFWDMSIQRAMDFFFHK